MLTRFTLTVAILLVACFGAAEALWSERWFPSPALREATDKFAAIPMTIGPWVGAAGELEERQVRQAEIKANMLRQYTNSETGQAVSVMLVAGRSGPICVHSPEVCLGSSGWSMNTAAERAKIKGDGLSANFWHTVFRKGEAVPEEMEIYWAWNTGKGWQAAASPRWEYIQDRVLYKVYVSRNVSGNTIRDDEESPIPGFLQRFLPEVDRAVFDK